MTSARYGASYPPSVLVKTVGAAGAQRGAVKPGDGFTTTPEVITGSDAANAAKLKPLGFVVAPANIGPWTAGQEFRVNGDAFHWTGTAFAAGPA